MIILRIYLFYRINHYQTMKQKHIYAHKTHRVTGVVLPILTTMCILIKIVFQIEFLLWRVCVDEQRVECEAFENLERE